MAPFWTKYATSSQFGLISANYLMATHLERAHFLKPKLKICKTYIIFTIQKYYSFCHGQTKELLKKSFTSLNNCKIFSNIYSLV